MRARLFASTLVLFALAAPAERAYAADVQACLAASEKGQHARGAGKLREAREHFLLCGNEACPAIVRRDCAQWTSELGAALPTVVFGAKDKSGQDLFDVTVSMDGEVVVEKLDGKAVFVDPGPHTFRFDTPGAEPVTERALIKEGEKSRVITVSFGGGGGSSTATAGGASAGGGGGETGTTEGGGGHSVLPWIVVGVGAVGVAAGIVIVATTPERPATCNKDTQTCTRLPGQSDADFAADQEQAGKADSQPVLGWAVTGVGAAFVIGGLLWHFLEPTGDKSATATRLRLSPWTTGTASGFSLSRSF